MFTNKLELKNLAKSIPSSYGFGFGFTAVNVTKIAVSRNYIFTSSESGIIFPFKRCLLENEEVLKPMKASKDSGKVTVLKLSYDLDYLALGHDSGIINVMKLPVKGNQEKLEQLLIEDIHKDNKIVDIIWSKCGNIIYVGDVSGNVTEIVISWSEKKIQFKFLDINYYPVVAICLNEDENVLCYVTSYDVSSLILADKKKPVKKVVMLFGDESANERVFYRALVGVEVRKGTNERDVVLACDKEGSVFVFDALIGQLLKEYGLSESENIQSILKVSINSFITHEDRILNCYNYANKEFLLASSWESHELSENISLYNSNNDSEVEEDYKILDIAYDYDSNLVFCLLEPKLILCFSKNKIDLVEANLSFETTLEIINREDGALSLLQSTKKSTKAFIEKNIPEAFAKIKTAADSIKYAEEENTGETVVYAFDEIVMNEVDDRNEKPNCDLVVAPRKRKVGVVQPPSNFLGMHSTIIECAGEDYSPINCIEEEIDDDLMDNLQSLLEGTSIINKADSECASEITEITENCETNNNHNILQISETLQNKSKSEFYFANDSPSSILDYKDTLVKIQPFYLSTPQNSQNSLQPLVLTHHNSQSNRPKQIYQAIGKVTDIWSHDSLQFKIDHMAISKSFFLALSECSQKLLYKALNLNGSQSYGWMEVNNFAETSIYCNDDGSILCKGLQGVFYFTQVEDGHIGKVLSTDDWNVLGYEGPIDSISITNKNVWYITKFGVFVRIALLHENILCPIDFEIDNIECVKMSDDSKLKLIETSEKSVWLLLKDEKTIYVRTGLEHCQMGLEWVELESKLPSRIVGLSLYEEFAFALNKDGRLFMLAGISLTNPQGDSKGWFEITFNFTLHHKLSWQIKAGKQGLFIKAGSHIHFIKSSMYLTGHRSDNFAPAIYSMMDGFVKLTNVSFGHLFALHRNGEVFCYDMTQERFKNVTLDFADNINEVQEIVYVNGRLGILTSHGKIYTKRWLKGGNSCEWNQLENCEEPLECINSFCMYESGMYLITSNQKVWRYRFNKRSFKEIVPPIEEIVKGIHNKLELFGNLGQIKMFPDNKQISITTNYSGKNIWITDKLFCEHYCYDRRRSKWQPVLKNDKIDVRKLVVGEDIVYGINRQEKGDKLNKLKCINFSHKSLKNAVYEFKSSSDLKNIASNLSLYNENESGCLNQLKNFNQKILGDKASWSKLTQLKLLDMAIDEGDKNGLIILTEDGIIKKHEICIWPNPSNLMNINFSDYPMDSKRSSISSNSSYTTTLSSLSDSSGKKYPKNVITGPLTMISYVMSQSSTTLMNTSSLAYDVKERGKNFINSFIVKNDECDQKKKFVLYN